jgi:flagellar protein FliL
MAKKKKDKDPPEEEEADEKKAKEDGEEGAEGEGAEGAEGEEGGKKKLPIVKIAIFAGAPLLLIIIGVVVALMLGVFGKHEDKTADKAAAAKPAADEVQFYDLPEILVNLNTGGQTQAYLKLQVAIELPKSAQIAAIEPALPRIIDRFQVFLRELRLEDLSGSAGTYRLKQELLRRARLSGLAVPVNDVLIREMIIQ